MKRIGVNSTPVLLSSVILRYFIFSIRWFLNIVLTPMFFDLLLTQSDSTVLFFNYQFTQSIVRVVLTSCMNNFIISPREAKKLIIFLTVKIVQNMENSTDTWEHEKCETLKPTVCVCIRTIYYTTGLFWFRMCEKVV